MPVLHYFCSCITKINAWHPLIYKPLHTYMHENLSSIANIELDLACRASIQAYLAKKTILSISINLVYQLVPYTTNEKPLPPQYHHQTFTIITSKIQSHKYQLGGI